MSVIGKLSTSLGRNDETPNSELALLIAGSEDREAVKELVDNLVNQNKWIQSDCIKVLYEVAEQKPELIAPYNDVFISLLDSKNNRLVWGAMTALDHISNVNPDKIYRYLPRILDAGDKGSVISKDHVVSILVKLAGNREYHHEVSGILLDQLSTCPPNQLPMYAENAFAVLSQDYSDALSELLRARLGQFDKESKRKRVEKVIARIARSKGGV